MQSVNKHQIVTLLNKTGSELSKEELYQTKSMEYALIQYQASLHRELGLNIIIIPFDEFVNNSIWNNDFNISFVILNKTYIGICYWCYDSPEEDMESCKIYGIYIKPEHQHKGYGKLLLTHVLKQMQIKYPNVPASLGVMSNNTSALSLYKRFGFDTTVSLRLIKQQNITTG